MGLKYMGFLVANILDDDPTFAVVVIIVGGC
jgi:hypothetical protein